MFSNSVYGFRLSILLIMLFVASGISYGQDTTATVKRDSTLVNKYEAGDEAADAGPKRKLVRFNEYQGPIFSIKVGGGYLEDAALYQQDSASSAQVDDRADTKLRDLRAIFKGRLGRVNAKWKVTYTVGVMFDAPTGKLLFRETGIMVGAPILLHSHFFIGRTKEGFSLNKVMPGYAGWTMERSSWSDASVPILGDGIKWIGYLSEPRILWNIGYFFDGLNEEQSFSTYDNQIVARIMYLPIHSEADKTILHTGINLRLGHADKDTLQLRARPESWTAPFYVDTKKFRAAATFMYGAEIYYRKGPWMVGSEYWLQSVSSPENGNPTFHGGDIVVTWLITGETREYNTVGGFFTGISPKKTVFEGGPGAFEAVLRFSYIDLDAGKIQGGRFWRITPMVNWHVSDNIRFELAYGYGQLDRFDLIGGTNFFQGRVQFQL